MLASPHTRLMNCVIGLTKKDVGWPTVLADLGYEVQVIEQTIRTSKGGEVRPDIIAVSNRNLHCIVFDCKGGKKADDDQLENYKGLASVDLSRWVTVYDSSKLSHDVCYVSFAGTSDSIALQVNPFPLLAFGEDSMKKLGTFSQRTLNIGFASPIPIGGLRPPVSYYPFCELDPDAVIVPRVLRMLVQIALHRAKGGKSALEDATFTSEEIAMRTHPYWKALSLDQRAKLKNKVRELIHTLLQTEPELKKALNELEGKKGYKITGTLQQLQREAERIATEMETQGSLETFFQ